MFVQPLCGANGTLVWSVSQSSVEREPHKCGINAGQVWRKQLSNLIIGCKEKTLLIEYLPDESN